MKIKKKEINPDRMVKTAEVTFTTMKVLDIASTVAAAGAATICGLQASKAEKDMETLAWAAASAAFGTYAGAKVASYIGVAIGNRQVNDFWDAVSEDIQQDVQHCKEVAANMGMDVQEAVAEAVENVPEIVKDLAGETQEAKVVPIETASNSNIVGNIPDQQ